MANLSHRLFFTLLTAVGGLSGPLAHAHGDHGHEPEKKKMPKARESGISAAVGVSFTKGLGASGAAETGSTEAPADDHSSHTHLALHGGEDHGDTGKSAGAEPTTGDAGTTAPAFDPMFTARVGYQFTKKLGLGLNLGYGLSGGLSDPEFGPSLRLSLSKRLSMNGAFTATAPLSKSSRANFKITSIKLTGGPTLTIKKLSLGVTATVGYLWYSKTIIVDPVTEPAAGGRISAAPHALLLDAGHDEGAGAPSGGAVGPSGDNLATTDREFSRWGARGSVGYQILKSLRADSSFGAAIVNRQFGASTWATDATVAQLTFLRKGFSAYGGIGLSAEAKSFAVPSSPFGSVGLGYEFK